MKLGTQLKLINYAAASGNKVILLSKEVDQIVQYIHRPIHVNQFTNRDMTKMTQPTFASNFISHKLPDYF